jgi:hypothetical protein
MGVPPRDRSTFAIREGRRIGVWFVLKVDSGSYRLDTAGSMRIIG